MSVILWYNESVLVQQQRTFHDECKYSDIRNIPMLSWETQSKVEFLFDDPFQEFLFKVVWMHVLL